MCERKYPTNGGQPIRILQPICLIPYLRVPTRKRPSTRRLIRSACTFCTRVFRPLSHQHPDIYIHFVSNAENAGECKENWAAVIFFCIFFHIHLIHLNILYIHTQYVAEFVYIIIRIRSIFAINNN